MSNDFNDPYRTPTSASSKHDFGGQTSEDRTWALIAHLSPLLGYVVPVPFFNILAPLGVWFIKRESSSFVDDQAKESVNFQITIFLASLVCLVLIFAFFIGIVLGIVLVIYSLVMMAIAAKSAQEGKAYRYPFCLRLF